MENNQSQNPIGSLFDTVNYYNLDDLDKFITSMSYEQAMYFLVEAVQSAYRRNSFTMAESEVISKSIRTLSKPITPKEPTE
jgi:hypothetical protein